MSHDLNPPLPPPLSAAASHLCAAAAISGRTSPSTTASSRSTPPGPRPRQSPPHRRPPAACGRSQSSPAASLRRPSVILGVTNPFFAKTLQHWPHIIRIGDMKQAGRWAEQEPSGRWVQSHPPVPPGTASSFQPGKLSCVQRAGVSVLLRGNGQTDESQEAEKPEDAGF